MAANGGVGLAARIAEAFRGVPALPAERIVDERYRGNDDVHEMAAAFAGRHWTELAPWEVFYHRESLFMLSAAGLRSYLPAYLAGCLGDDPRLVPDIVWYTVSALRARRDAPGLDDDQRAVVEAVLRHVDGDSVGSRE